MYYALTHEVINYASLTHVFIMYVWSYSEFICLFIVYVGIHVLSV